MKSQTCDAVQNKAVDGDFKRSTNLNSSTKWRKCRSREKPLFSRLSDVSDTFVSPWSYLGDDRVRFFFDGNGSLDERLWAEQDANHNVTSIMNNSGVVQERFVYDPYGKATVLDANWAGTSDTKSWNVLFQGLRWDSTAEDYKVRNRRYDPTLGRFTTQDPAGYINGANLYQFVTSNPLQNCDPTGLYVPSHLPTTAPKATISEWDKWNNEVNRLGAQINALGIERAQLTDFIDKVLPNVCVSPVDYWLELEDALRERALLEAKTKVLQQQWTNAILKRQAAQRDKRP